MEQNETSEKMVIGRVAGAKLLEAKDDDLLLQGETKGRGGSVRRQRTSNDRG